MNSYDCASPIDGASEIVATALEMPLRQNVPGNDGNISGMIVDVMEQPARDWSLLRILIVGLCSLLNALDGMDIVILSYVAPVLAKDWSLSPERLGMVFSASLAGMTLGCLFIAPLADRFGRRPVILSMLTLIMISMMASAFSISLPELVLTRFLTGIGIGAMLASMTAVAAEFAPQREKALAISIMLAGYPLGSVATGMVAAAILPHHHWQVILLGAGILSLAVLPVVFLILPESIDFLLRTQPKQALQRVNRIEGRLGVAVTTALPPKPPKVDGFVLRSLFESGRAEATSALWVGVFMGFMTLYFALSWITKLAAQAGLPLENAIYAGAIFNFGAFMGTIAVGRLARDYGLRRSATIALALAAGLLTLFGAISMPLVPTLLLAMLVGMTIYGGFNAFYGLAAELYPAANRSTGVGWAMGIGRFGAVTGPLLGGVLIGQGFSLMMIMAIFSVPLLIAAFMASRIRSC